MSHKSIDKTTFNDLLMFQKIEVVNSLLTLVMSGHTISWQNTQRAKVIYLRDDNQLTSTLPGEIKPAIIQALESFNRAPNGFTLRQLMPSLATDDAA
ncbi:hypothetical protein [Alteromonas australica]|uniref:Uncharacterized protein n=1 Tax=Alteromonas australica TaxID=589873 RepID=A0A358E2G4_9ALTE|nr:hypothetical protein [Alteromonas australica]MBU35346.1 hypothetical protein [Alteromonas sp.]HBU52165.1 hypothetical protein [Alteromonas australica]|tara:strand:- start:6 stop:296 length:291 start_codon:yes stop_codon:yes gene_type:complete